MPPTPPPLWPPPRRGFSLGWTTTNPCPANPSWNASPDPRPSIAIGLKPDDLSEVCREADHATTASVSTKVGASTASTTGVPLVVMASFPLPEKWVLNSPPPIIPALPIILMSHCSVGSKASTLTPLTEKPMPGDMVTMMLATLALAALALCFGALFPRFKTENAADIATGFGGLVFMMTSISYLVLIIGIEAWPVYMFLRQRAELGAATGEVTGALVVGIGAATLLSLVVIFVALAVARRRVGDIETS